MDPLLLDPSLLDWPLPDAPLPRAGRFDDRLAPPLDFVDALPVVSELPRADDPLAVRVLALTVAPAEVRDDDRTAVRSLDPPVAIMPRRRFSTMLTSLDGALTNLLFFFLTMLVLGSSSATPTVVRDRLCIKAVLPLPCSRVTVRLEEPPRTLARTLTLLEPEA